jgi:hypothetical protein
MHPEEEEVSETNEARARRYGRTIWETSRADESTISATGADIVARAVIAVADEEQAELRAEVERLTRECLDREATETDARERLRRCEERLAAMEALRQQWIHDSDPLRPSRVDVEAFTAALHGTKRGES